MPSSTENTSKSRPALSIAETIQQGGLALCNEGTETDVHDVLIGCADIENIFEGGTYILGPNKAESTTNDLANGLYGTVERLLSHLKEKNIQGAVKALIPLEDGDHWRLAIIEIEGLKITSQILWDPMRSSLTSDNNTQAAMATAVSTAANEVMQQNVAPLEFIKANVQTSSVTCMDHVLKKAYQESDETNAITRATNDDQLRRAVIDTIANNKGLNVVEQRSEETHGALSDLPQWQELNQETLTQILTTLSENSALCGEFDAIFARNLQDLYDDPNNKGKAKEEEESLVDQARKASFQECCKLQNSCYAAFFKAQKPTTTCHQEANTESPQDQSTLTAQTVT